MVTQAQLTQQGLLHCNNKLELMTAIRKYHLGEVDFAAQRIMFDRELQRRCQGLQVTYFGQRRVVSSTLRSRQRPSQVPMATQIPQRSATKIRKCCVA